VGGVAVSNLGLLEVRCQTWVAGGALPKEGRLARGVLICVLLYILELGFSDFSGFSGLYRRAISGFSG
jgi:hypothetical protein